MKTKKSFLSRYKVPILIVCIVFIIPVLIISGLLVFKNLILKKTIGLEYQGTKDGYLAQLAQTAGQDSQQTDIEDTSTDIDDNLTDGQGSPDGNVTEPNEISSLALNWEYYIDAYSSDYISGTTYLDPEQFKEEITFSKDGKLVQITINQEVANYILNDMIKQSEPEWYEKVKDAFRIEISNNLLLIETDFLKSNYTGWWKILEGISIVLQLNNDKDNILTFKALILGNDVYKIEPNSDLAEAADRIVTSSNKTLSSLELTIDDTSYTPKEARVEGEKINILFEPTI